MSSPLSDIERSQLGERLASLQQHHLGKRLYLALWKPAPSAHPDDLMRTLPEHFEFLHHLERRGILFASGPLNDDDGSGPPSGGMSIFRVDSLAAARTLVESEPFVRAGLRTYTLKRWTFNEGRIALRLDVGTGTYDVI
jgi:uncharacterized protein YciI